MPASKEYREFLELVRDIGMLEQIGGLLSWDEQTYMPPGSFQQRARYNAVIAGVVHEKLTSQKMGKLIKALKKQKLSSDGEAILRNVERKYKRASSMPADLVKEITRTASLGMEAWVKARSDSDFKKLEPLLDRMIGLKFRETECIGYEDRPYDALLDEYEPGMKAGDIDLLFPRFLGKLKPIAEKILGETEPVDVIPPGTYPLEEQRKFIARLCSDIGFDMNCGRIDISAHPFTSGTGSDVRITVKYDENNPAIAIFPALHETGHALYEQGFLEKYYHTPLADAISLGIHESQSRFWENVVGRSIYFWKYQYPKLQHTFPGIGKMSPDAFHRYINRVKRSYIRIDADEMTYNMHIMLRYDVESAIFDGKLKTHEIPAFWNERFKNYLDIEVPDDASGCLQDIHWSIGAFGYFPTYALGNIYSAQLWDAAKRKIPGLEDRIMAGDVSVLLDWLRKNVHRHGKRYDAKELIRRVTGETINEDHFIRYAKEKYGSIYGISL
ncbi:carboxypeptidase M32 [Methanocella sp. CWC-04]|uniref:Metal-dependent carboxypeptidase n=1 Tax=Methanooceanicella nereidis TaxID=2052831 RepID=A0AAP2W4B6_9EURY|nr:carboxypeptidase M32 [Methanocella sp. CWC-04]MCD1294060.1 carboxypeptidase M32 [Methanocella sp. CWC-04]